MPTIPIHFVDVFAREQYTGNQLAVVRDADTLSQTQMQRIAAEIDYAETAFVRGETDEGVAVRVFTPQTELPFAGHPALGTAHVLREHAGAESPIVLDLPAGPTTVTVADQDGQDDRPDHPVYWMQQRAPDFGDTVDPIAVTRILGLDPDDIAPDWPIHPISTGLETLVIPVITREALCEATFDRAAFREFAQGRDTRHLTLFCPEPRDDANDLAVRVLRDATPPDDAATGSANGCLAAYLARHECLGGPTVDVRVEQGDAVDRSSLLFLRADGSADDFDVRVGGRVIPVADGHLR